MPHSPAQEAHADLGLIDNDHTEDLRPGNVDAARVAALTASELTHHQKG